MSRESLVILAVVLGAAGVSAEPVSTGPEAGTAAAVRLAYKFSPGDVDRYRISQKVTGESALSGAYSSTPIDFELSSTIRLQCIRALPNGGAELTIETEAATLKIGGKPSPNYKPDTEIRTVQIAPTGRLVTPAKGDKDERKWSYPPRLDFGFVESIIFMGILPEAPVAKGSTWSAEIPLPIEGSNTLKLAFALEGVESTSTGSVANIKQQLNALINRNVPSESELPRGKQEGESTFVFDIDRGRLISAQGAIRSELQTKHEVPSIPDVGGGLSQQSVAETTTLATNFRIDMLNKASTSDAPAK